MTNHYKKVLSKEFTENKKVYNLVAICEISSINGQSPYFSITGECWQKGYAKSTGTFGMLHDIIEKQFPGLRKFLKWHLTSIQSPMQYLANSLYWAGFSGYCDGKKDSPPKLEYLKSTCIYGAVESDYSFDIENLSGKESLTNWLVARLPELMNQFDLEMLELFPDFQYTKKGNDNNG
jgi:hypothetical protein